MGLVVNVCWTGYGQVCMGYFRVCVVMGMCTGMFVSVFWCVYVYGLVLGMLVSVCFSGYVYDLLWRMSVNLCWCGYIMSSVCECVLD